MKVVGKVLGSSHKNFINGVENVSWGHATLQTYAPSGSNFNKNLHKVVHEKSEVRNDDKRDTNVILIFHNLNSKVHWYFFFKLSVWDGENCQPFPVVV